jgi:hypothetical protein
VTCYPFYFVGHAPRRYIVRCLLRDRHTSTARAGNPPNVPALPTSGE